MRPIERIAQGDAITREIIAREMTAALDLFGNDGAADIAIDKETRSVFGDPFEAIAELPVAEDFARCHRLAARREDAFHARARGQDRGDDGEEIGLERAQRKTGPRRA